MRWMLVAVIAVAAGCGSSKQAGEDNAAQGSAKPAPAAVEAMPIAFGDCSAGSFVSGPRPLPVASTDDPPPPPEEDMPDDGKDESGGTGTAMALDEAKMGRKPGEYHMKGPVEQERQQAIELARTTGILGTVARRDEVGIYSALPGAAVNLAIGARSFGKLGNGSTGHDSPLDSHAGGPAVAIGSPTAQSAGDKDMIRRFIHRNISKVTYCYEKQLLVKPMLAGTVTVKFFITPQGNVAEASASGLDPEVSSCVAKFVGEIKFAKPEGGGGIQVSYPFVFRPAGDDNARATGSASAPAAHSGSATPAPTPAPTLFRTDNIDAEDYHPGLDNALRTEQAALVKCLRGDPKPYGVAVVDLAGPNTKVYGLDDSKTAACVAEVAKRVLPLGDKPRCSFAFGVMPPAALPTLDLTADTVTFAGKPLATAQAIAATDPNPAPQVADAIRATVTAALVPGAPIVAIHGPIVVRPVDATSIKLLTRVLAGVLASGDDFVLAAQRGGAWQLLEKLELPVVPVPLGSGGRWNHIKGSPTQGGPSSHHHLSLLIGKDTIWLSGSPMIDPVVIPRDAQQWTALGKALESKKAIAGSRDRSNIELAGDDDASYGDLVHAIDAVKTAGFSDWELTDPKALAAPLPPPAKP